MGRRIESPRPSDDLYDKFEIVVDPDAEPADWDEVLLDFVSRIVERRLAGRTGLMASDSSNDGAMQSGKVEIIMDQERVERLEAEVAKAIHQVFRRLAKGRSFKKPSNDVHGLC